MTSIGIKGSRPNPKTFSFKGRGKRLAAPIYIRLEKKERENTKPKQLEERNKAKKIKRVKRNLKRKQKTTSLDQQDLSY